MAGIYIHIPFCKQACHYCDFHFSTSMKTAGDMAEAICAEVVLQKDFLQKENIETIYFGGGTPSLLPLAQLSKIMAEIKGNFAVSGGAEITLEANPDDINPEKLSELKSLGINRLSIGIQSFSDEILKWMNRAHSGAEATNSVKLTQAAGFENITIDLIYGVPGLSSNDWSNTLRTAIDLGVDHISSYCLTVESGTALGHRVAKGTEQPVDEELAAEHFQIMVKILEDAGYEQYEISNFARHGRYSRHNTNYWTGEKYLGLGPSAHSYDGFKRSWNVSSNTRYIKAIMEGNLPSDYEILTQADRYNEWVMTGLRTRWGIEPAVAQKRFGFDMETQFGASLKDLIESDLATMNEGRFTLTRKGRILADGIASELFITD
jgi:oxygen-independent coproporphyrinogen-3 oxidase